MWLTAASTGDAQNALVLAIVGTVSAVLVAIFTGVFQLLTARQGRQQQSAPENSTTILFERTAVLAARADDSDDRDEAQDRRLDMIERHLDIDNPNWRPGHE